MYTREGHGEERRDVLVAAMREIKLATLVSATPDGLFATHMPMLVEQAPDGSVTLDAHMARNNAHWRAAGDGAASLAIFQGPHSYISPSWYATKQQDGKVVPTWTYIAVHAHGRLELVKDQDWLHAHVAALTDRHEGERAEPWALSDAPEDYVAVMLRGIVGVRLHVERLEGAWKLNQHRSAEDQHSMVAGLESEGGEQRLAIARAMRRACPAFATE